MSGLKPSALPWNQVAIMRPSSAMAANVPDCQAPGANARMTASTLRFANAASSGLPVSSSR